MPSRAATAAALLALLLGAHPASAGIWVPIGPTQPRVFVLATDPSDAKILYAGGRGVGVFRSRNRGQSWLPARQGLPRGDLLALAIDPADTATLYAGTDFGVFKSGDAGASWNLASPDLQSSTTALALALSSPSILYAGSEWGDGIAKSNDGGATWSVVWREEAATGPYAVLALAVDPTDADRVYALVQPSGFLRSADGGTTWERFGSGASWSASAALLVDPEDPARVYAAANAFFHSADYGATWRQRDPSASLFWAALAITRTAPASLYVAGAAGVFVTTDPTGDWTRLPVGEPGTWCEALATDGADRVWVGTTEGVLASDDGGRSWEPRQRGFFGGNVNALAAAPTHPPTLYVAPTSGGILVSSDDGASWVPSGPDLEDDFIYDVVVDPTQPSTLYAARFSANEHGGGVSKSTDGGATWTFAREGLPRDLYDGPSAPHASVTRLLFDPADPRTLYAVMHAADAGVYRTRDGAATWTAAGLGGEPGITDDATTLAVDPAQTGRLYAGAGDGFVYGTRDGGDTWTRLARLSTEAVSALAVDPNQPDIVFAGLYTGGVQRSTDAGLTWSAVGPPPLAGAPVNDLAIDANGVVYADTMEGVFRSRDHGRSWDRFDEGLFPEAGQYGWSRFFLDPAVPGRVYRIMEGSGVYRRDRERRGDVRDVRVVRRRGSWDLVVRGTLGDIPGDAIDPARSGVGLRLDTPTAGTLVATELPAAGWRRFRRSWVYLGDGPRARLRIREGRADAGATFVLRASGIGLASPGDGSLSVAVMFEGSLDPQAPGAVAVGSDLGCRRQRGPRAFGCRPR